MFWCMKHYRVVAILYRIRAGIRFFIFNEYVENCKIFGLWKSIVASISVMIIALHSILHEAIFLHGSDLLLILLPTYTFP
jgi:hypothetical protein